MKKSKRKILVVDDEQNIRKLLKIFLTEEGYSVEVADNGESGLEAVKNHIFDLVITDLKMPKLSGFDLLKGIKEISPDTIVVIVTAFGTTESAVEAMKLGAFDYIQKPFKIDDIRLIVKNALDKHALQEELSILKEQFKSTSLENIIGNSPAMLNLFSLISKTASSNANVLITGESGTGKELVAMAIHNMSPIKDNRFVAINCAAIPEGLLESELFGHMRGAFSGATANKQGLFEHADGGTLFMDEIGDMPLNLQAKLLRVIENNLIRRVGGVSDIKVDVRLISATNTEINKLIEEKRFREDLFFRLNVLSIKVPPLRERREDIPILIEHFMKKYTTGKTTFSQDAIAMLSDYYWKGNVRELENIIERLLLICDRDIIAVEDLPEEIRLISTAESVSMPSDGISIEKLIENTEKAYLLKALENTNGVKTEAAKLLKLTFRSFRHRLKKYGIDKKIITD
jgi:two-component system response regulator PilR (NtrC family)